MKRESQRNLFMIVCRVAPESNNNTRRARRTMPAAIVRLRCIDINSSLSPGLKFILLIYL